MRNTAYTGIPPFRSAIPIKSVTINSEDLPTCVGNVVTITAVIDNVYLGAIRQYYWLVNGVATSIGSLTLETNSLVNGDVIVFIVEMKNGDVLISNSITVIATIPATVNAGVNQTICKGLTVQLNGSIGGGASSATWSGGLGTYAPNANTLNAVYTPNVSELGNVTLTLTTNDPEGACGAVSDTMIITINNCITEVHYGLLYNWYAATDARKITSSDTWTLPSPAQWNEIPALFSNDYIATNNAMCESGNTHWSSGTDRNNALNFNGRGSGIRDVSPLSAPTTSIFTGLTRSALFWSNLSSNNTTQYLLRLLATGTTTDAHCFGWLEHRRNGFSIRLRRIATAEEQLLVDGTACEPYTGNDGKIYRTVKIGTQVWLADNLAETKFRNGDIIPFAGANGINFSNAEWVALTTAGCCPYNNDWNNV